MPLTTTPRAARTARKPRHWLWLASLGSLTMIGGLLSPMLTASAAGTGKPAVSVSAIGSSGSLKLSWKAVKDDAGRTVSKYQICYGKTSSVSTCKTVYFGTTGVAGPSAVKASPSSPSYVLGFLSPSTTYYARVTPYKADGRTLGTKSSVVKKKTGKFGYKPPVEVHVANMTRTTAEIVFRTVTGAPIYRIKATAKGHSTRYAWTGADGNWVITGLDPKTKYTFTVSCAQSLSGGYAQLSGESKAKATGTTTNYDPSMTFPVTYLNDAPVDNALALATPANPTASQFYNGANVTLRVPDGFDWTKHKVRFVYAKDQRMTTGRGQAEWAPTAPPAGDPSSSTTTIQPNTNQQPATPSSSPTPSETTTAPEAPATTPAVPESTPPAPETTAPQESTAPPSAESPSAVPQTPASSPSEAASAGTETAQEATATLLAARPRTYQTRLALPSPNSNYYVRLQIVWRSTYVAGPNSGKSTGHAAGSTVSDKSQALVVKTRSKFGFISGRVVQDNGAALPAEVCRDYVVLAYGKASSGFRGGTGLDVHKQLSLVHKDKNGKTVCDGTFSLEVRPNSGYTVQALYVGTAGATTWRPAWYAQGKPGVTARSYGATPITVSVGATKALANPIRVGLGFSASGTAPCGAKSGRCTVDVAAMVNPADPNTVVAIARSNSSGGFTLKGLPKGTYTLRVSQPEDGTYAKISDALKAKPNAKNWKTITVG